MYIKDLRYYDNLLSLVYSNFRILCENGNCFRFSVIYFDSLGISITSPSLTQTVLLLFHIRCLISTIFHGWHFPRCSPYAAAHPAFSLPNRSLPIRDWYYWWSRGQVEWLLLHFLLPTRASLSVPTSNGKVYIFFLKGQVTFLKLCLLVVCLALIYAFLINNRFQAEKRIYMPVPA